MEDPAQDASWELPDPAEAMPEQPPDLELLPAGVPDQVLDVGHLVLVALVCVQRGLQDWVWDVAHGGAWQQQDQVRDKVVDVEDPAWDTRQQRADQVVDQREVVGVSIEVAQD